jgi:hypothetical protein
VVGLSSLVADPTAVVEVGDQSSVGEGVVDLTVRDSVLVGGLMDPHVTGQS